MSLVVVSPGTCITVPLLFHQLWVSPRYNELRFEDVFDFVVRNEGEEALSRLLVLYPHDVYQFENGPYCDAQVLGFGPLIESDYDWYFSERPKFVDGRECVFSFKIPSGGHGGREFALRAVSCDATVSICRELCTDAATAGASSVVRSTLLELSFGRALSWGETGTVRLRVLPRAGRLGVASEPVAMATRADAPDHRFCWDLCIESSDLIWERTREKLRAEIRRADEQEQVTLDRFGHVVGELVSGRRGTATRIVDHRIAVVASSDTEVVPLNTSDSVKLVHTLPLRREGQDRRVTSYVATVWATGSRQNEQKDVWHTLDRIVNHFLYINRAASREEIIEKVGQANQPEACALLMTEATLAGIMQVSTVTKLYALLLFDKDRPDFLKALRDVCVKYEDVQRGHVPVSGGEFALYSAFRNAHRFQNMLRVRWDSFPEGYKEAGVLAREELRQFRLETQVHRGKAWRWTLAAFILAIASALLTVIGWFFH